MLGIIIFPLFFDRYVFLAPSSRFRGENDMAKYEKARELSKHVDKIREDYTKALGSSNESSAQLATALYLIDRLALRVGNEKDTEEEADTVG
jgi:DNA topoisomerase-1